MLNLDEVPDDVLEALSNRFDEDRIGEEAFFEKVKILSGKEAFEEYCAWYGLLGWSNTLWKVIEGLKKAELGEKKAPPI